MEMSLLKVNGTYERATSWFSELVLCLLCLKNTQPKIILRPKGHILGWHNLLPFRFELTGNRDDLLNTVFGTRDHFPQH